MTTIATAPTAPTIGDIIERLLPVLPRADDGGGGLEPATTFETLDDGGFKFLEVRNTGVVGELIARVFRQDSTTLADTTFVIAAGYKVQAISTQYGAHFRVEEGAHVDALAVSGEPRDTLYLPGNHNDYELTEVASNNYWLTRRVGQLVERIRVSVSSFQEVRLAFADGSALAYELIPALVADPDADWTALASYDAAITYTSHPTGRVVTIGAGLAGVPCDGRTIDRADYPALFDALGVGDAIKTLTVPTIDTGTPGVYALLRG